MMLRGNCFFILAVGTAIRVFLRGAWGALHAYCPEGQHGVPRTPTVLKGQYGNLSICRPPPLCRQTLLDRLLLPAHRTLDVT